jgi:tRNA-dihydrouridine synthase 2
MIARSAERNPSIFLPAGPRCNITEVVPKFLNICEYIDNPWGNTKFLLAQYRPSAAPISSLSKSEKKAAQEAVTRSKSLIEVAEQLRITLGGGKEVMKDIADSISARTKASVFDERADAVAQGIAVDEETTQ